MDIRVRDRYLWIQYELLEMPEINGSDLLVYMVLARFVNNETQSCYPSYQKICDFGHITRPTVAKSIKHLEEMGLITVKRVTKRPNTYTLVDISSKNIELVKNNRNLVKNNACNNTNITRRLRKVVYSPKTYEIKDCSQGVRYAVERLGVEPTQALVTLIDEQFKDFAVKPTINTMLAWCEDNKVVPTTKTLATFLNGALKEGKLHAKVVS
jgi:DNA-binding MarR family transcriptional regulator